MTRFAGKVALVTGAARGQGRSHALGLAAEGADVIAVDLCSPIDSVDYAMPTIADLEEVAAEVEELDRRCVVAQVDVRDEAQLQAAVDRGVAELGRLDVVLGNAGVGSYGGPAHEMSREVWEDTVGVNLTGVWLTCKCAIPAMISGGAGGAIVITSSFAGFRPVANMAHYVASKHGVLGLARSLALELAPHSIRVNTIHPTQVDTPMIQNPSIYRVFVPGVPEPTREDFAKASSRTIPMPIPWVEPRDITNTALFLASDEARYITGSALSVDGGQMVG